jgi:hypothetical protein
MLQHKFVEFIPDCIEDGILYISIQYCTAIHKCVCGCGNEVVTPLSPTDWKLTFNGKTVSLHPSIGNWNFDCRSHYWIKDSEIEYATSWTEREIRLGRNNDLQRKKEQFEVPENSHEKVGIQTNQKLTIWRKISHFFRL